MRAYIRATLALAILVASFLVFRQNFRKIREERGATLHGHIVVAELYSIHASLRHAQSAWRGILLTGSDSEQAEYEAAVASMHKSVSKLAKALEGEPEQASRVKLLGNYLKIMLNHLQQESQKSPADLTQKEKCKSIRLCRSLTNKAISVGADIKDAEVGSLRRKFQEFDQARNQENLSVTIASLVGMVAIASTCVRSRQERGSARANHAETIPTQADLLESERKLREAKNEAEAANRAKDQFLAVLSHEMRTPLTPCLLTASSLALDMDLPEPARKAFGDIQKNLELEARLIDDLLDVMLIIKGKMSFHMTIIDAHHKISLASDICRPDLVDKDIRLETQLNAQQCHVTADAARFQQVVWNLIKNAVKFTPAGGTIKIRTYNKGEDLVIEVSDNGIGIKEEVLPTIFDAFIQGERHKGRKYGGLGLGLAISKAIVDGHKGRLEAFSDGEGQGSLFVATFQTTYVPSLAPPVFDQPTGPEEKCHVFYVEDDHPTRQVTAQLLQMAGYKVTMAANLQEALEIDCKSCDVLVSDIGLGDGTGHELMSTIRQRGCDVPGLALSGYGTEEDVGHSLSVGFAEHLTKPVAFPSLEAAIRRIANRR